MKHFKILLILICYSISSIAQTDIVTTTPEGSIKTYDMSTCQVYMNDKYDYSGIKTDAVVSDNGNKLWFKDFITAYGFGTWIYGDIKGDTLYIKSGQHIYHQDPIDNMPTIDLYIKSGTVSGSDFFTTDDEFIKLIIDKDGTIRTPDNKGIAAVDQYGDVLGKNYAYILKEFDAAKETIIPPTGLADTQYCLKYNDNLGNPIYRLVNVKTDETNKNMYIQGMTNTYNLNGWIKGTINNNTISFAQRQYQGIAEDLFFDFFYPGTKDYSQPNGYALTENLVFTRNPITGDLTTDGSALEMIGDKILAGSFDNPSLMPYTPHATIPAKPQMLDYSDYRNDYGFIVLRFNIAPIDIDGKYIDPKDITWRLIVDGQPYTFNKSTYKNLKEDTETFNWGFSDGMDIVFEACGLYNIWLYDNCHDIAAECSFTYDGQTYTSVSDPIHIEDNTTEINNAITNMPNTSVRYYDMQGHAVLSPKHGIYIRKERTANGHYRTQKILIK